MHHFLSIVFSTNETNPTYKLPIPKNKIITQTVLIFLIKSIPYFSFININLIKATPIVNNKWNNVFMGAVVFFYFLKKATLPLARINYMTIAYK
jgi:hypothetical protein